MDLPIRAPLNIQLVDGALVLHDERSGSTHRLNAVAQTIWELCDGTRDSAAIASEIAAEFGQSPADVRPDVENVLARFREVGLILSAPGSGHEAEVLTRAVRVAIGTAPPSPPGNFRNIDWNALVHMALGHGVMPLLYQTVTRHWGDWVPPIVVDRLESLYQSNAMLTKQLARELIDLLALFKEVLPAVTLKGPVLAQHLYGSVAARQAGDLDIFVPADRAAHAQHLMTARGYQFGLRYETHAMAMKAAETGQVAVDLQWALARRLYRFPVTLEEIWDRLIAVPVNGNEVLQPAPDDHALILCAHASKHCWSSLIWIADVAAFVQVHRSSLDWDRLLERANHVGGERQLLLGLRLAHDVLGVDLPAPVVRRLQIDASLDVPVAELQRRLFLFVEQPTYQGSFGEIRGGLFYMKTKERLQDRLPYVFNLLTYPFRTLRKLVAVNRHDRAFVDLPRPLTFLYVFVRPVRLTARFMRRRRRSPELVRTDGR